jgi:eukaryotic-like serine/threonine-protein kinase
LTAIAARRRIPLWLTAVGGAVVGGALVAAIVFKLLPPRVAPAWPMQFDLTPSPEMRLEEWSVGSISPDGRRFAFEATIAGIDQLVLRDTASSAFAILPGTQDALRPFWSSDGQSIAFFDGVDGHLKLAHLRGGDVRTLSESQGGGYPIERGGTWRGDVILFADNGQLYRLAASGGQRQLLKLVTNGKPPRAFSPCFLPDGRHFLFSTEESGVYVASLDAPGIKQVLDDASSAVYGSGHLFYSRGSALFARPFNAEQQQVSGSEVRLADRGFGLTVSDAGTIVYSSGRGGVPMLTWFDRQGRRTGTLGEPGPYLQMVLSPRSRYATVVRAEGHARDLNDLWNADLATGVFSRMTTASGEDSDPWWSPDEHSLVFTSERLGRHAPFLKDLVSGREVPLVAFDDPVYVDQWTPDGRFVIVRAEGGKRVYAVPMNGDRTPRLLLDTPYIKDEVHVSPDGRWVAFNANESGRWEVYLAAFPTFASKQQISAAGGVQPQWGADGHELFYLDPDGSMMSVRVEARIGLAVGAPSRLFLTRLFVTPNEPQYAVTADGQRFLGLERSAGDLHFTFLVNWLNAKSADGGGPVQ